MTRPLLPWTWALVVTAVLGGCTPGLSTRGRQAVGLATEEVSGSPPGLPLEDDGQWHLTLFHVHTEEGAWRYANAADLARRTIYNAGNARMVVRLAAARGVKVVVFTDHNSLQAPFDEQLQRYAQEVGVTVVGASEWSLGGPLAINTPAPIVHGGAHLCLVGYAASSPLDVIVPPDTRLVATPGLLRTAIAATHARGGAVVLAHPDAFNADYGLDAPLGFDLVEVDGPRTSLPWNAMARWQRWLMAGHRVAGISASEWHVGLLHDDPFRHMNLVRAEERTPQAITAALQAGHLMMVTRTRKIPRVLMGADQDGDGDFDDVREGDVMVPMPATTRARFQVRVIGASGHTLLLFGATSDRPIHEERFSEPEAVRAFSVELSPTQRTFVRAELWRRLERLVVTNPIYFDPVRPGLLRSPDAGAGNIPLDNGASPVETIRIIPVPGADAGPAEP